MNSVIRSYRESLKGFNITYKESDLFIVADNKLKKKAYLSLLKYRRIIEQHIEENPEFLTSLKPLKFYSENIEEILDSMYFAGISAGVGPFAAVAGAIAEFVAKDLKEYSEDILVENGGDIYIFGKKDKFIQVYLPGFNNIGIKIDKNLLPIGICSSSSKIGHSLSFGKAELVVVLSKSGALADAFATKICNKLKKEDDLELVINEYKKNKKIEGCILFFKKRIAGWGKFELIKTTLEK